MGKTELENLEELQGIQIDEILKGTGIEREVYSDYREGKKEISRRCKKNL